MGFWKGGPGELFRTCRQLPYGRIDRQKRRVGRFQNDLAGSKPPGFIGATSFQIEVVPWLSDLPGYEDWYLLDGSWAMDPLISNGNLVWIIEPEKQQLVWILE